MNRADFVASQDVDEKRAIRAWEVAGEDPEEARELLEVESVWLKGRFTDAEEDLHGLFVLRTDPETLSLEYIQGVVGTSDKFTQTDPGLDRSTFVDRITDLKRSHQQMGGSSDQLVEGLSGLWENEESTLVQDLLEADFDGLERALHNFLAEELELHQVRVDLGREVQRPIDDVAPPSRGEPDSSSEEGEEEETRVELPCRAEINPVKGVPVSRLNPEHYLYVDTKELPEQYQKLGPRLDERRDDSGLIPARIISKRKTDTGKLEIQVQFGDNVFGLLNTSRDVSLLVPSDTEKALETESSSRELDWLDAETAVIAVAGVLLFLLLFVWFFFL